MGSQARSRQRPSPALIVAMTALVAALAGTALAADPPTRAISKAKVKKIAANQVKKMAPDLSVASAARAETAGRADSAGSADTAGRADSAGRAENLLWAVVVDDDGPGNAAVVRAGQAGTTATDVGDGVVVDFGQPVTGCSWVATKGAIGSTTPGLPGGEATTEGVAGNPSGVHVEVRTSSGAFLDDPFHLLVAC